jgi:A nuclease family of the HNH/ENDO VII superfamily with conserved AHH
MISFREARRYRPNGFHPHHLIPIEVTTMQSLAINIGSARAAGFNPSDCLANGMFLPSLERNAVCFGLPLHRGPHPHYNRLVADRVAELENVAPSQLLFALNALQKALHIGLRRNQNNLACPTDHILCTTPDFSKIDSQIDLLWAATQPRVDSL